MRQNRGQNVLFVSSSSELTLSRFFTGPECQNRPTTRRGFVSSLRFVSAVGSSSHGVRRRKMAAVKRRLYRRLLKVYLRSNIEDTLARLNDSICEDQEKKGVDRSA